MIWDFSELATFQAMAIGEVGKLFGAGEIPGGTLVGEITNNKLQITSGGWNLELFVISDL